MKGRWAGQREAWSSCMATLLTVLCKPLQRVGPCSFLVLGDCPVLGQSEGGVSRVREGCWPGVCLENWEGCPGGLGALEVGPLPANVTISLLIWPQEDDVVPPGMESLISAPLVKTSEKEKEQVSLWRGPSEFGGVGPYPPGGIWGGEQGLETLTPDLPPLPGPHHVQQVPAALPLSVHALQRDPAHPQEAGAAPGQGPAHTEQAETERNPSRGGAAGG